MMEQPFGTSPFATPEPTKASRELQTDFYEDRVHAPAVGKSVALTHGPLVEQNAVVKDSSGTEYVLGLDYFETLAVKPGRIENLAIEEGTLLIVSYFYFTGGPALADAVDGTPPTTGRYATLLKFGG